jgi:hypothetical protein
LNALDQARGVPLKVRRERMEEEDGKHEKRKIRLRHVRPAQVFEE